MDDANKNLAAIPKGKKKKRDPGKRCAVMYCNDTNADNVSMHQFPRPEALRRQWIQFVLRKRDDNWTQVLGIFAVTIFLQTASREWGRNWPGLLRNCS